MCVLPREFTQTVAKIHKKRLYHKKKKKNLHQGITKIKTTFSLVTISVRKAISFSRLDRWEKCRSFSNSWDRCCLLTGGTNMSQEPRKQLSEAATGAAADGGGTHQWTKPDTAAVGSNSSVSSLQLDDNSSNSSVSSLQVDDNSNNNSSSDNTMLPLTPRGRDATHQETNDRKPCRKPVNTPGGDASHTPRLRATGFPGNEVRLARRFSYR